MFSSNDVKCPAPISQNVADTLGTLQVGDSVQLSFGQESLMITRTPSTYGGEPLPRYNGTYQVTCIDNDSEISQPLGMRSITVIPAQSTVDQYFTTWMISTDGYVREVEGWGIQSSVSGVTKL